MPTLLRGLAFVIFVIGAFQVLLHVVDNIRLGSLGLSFWVLAELVDYWPLNNKEK